MVAAHPLRQGLFAWLLALVLGPGPAGVVAAHPFHASYAELSWNEAGDALQVALRVIPEDLESALSRAAGRRVLLDPDAPPAPLIEDYLGRHFRISTAGGTSGPPAFLGLEVAWDETWLYFTLPVARSAAPLTLRNSLLFDVAEAQSNRVRRLWAPEAPVLVFTAGEPSLPLPVNE
ncbi:MAG: DUF6702 family protein [Pseudohaliea sp.]